MSENLQSRNIAEIGRDTFGKLTQVLEDREQNGYNAVGWGGTGADLKKGMGEGSLCPASAFGVVAEGLVRYKRQGGPLQEDIDNLRQFGAVMSEGASIYVEAGEVDEDQLKGQIKSYIESHGGVFDEKINWSDFIRERSERLMSKAAAIEEANS